jgi:hypothetical protein
MHFPSTHHGPWVDFFWGGTRAGAGTWLGLSCPCRTEWPHHACSSPSLPTLPAADGSAEGRNRLGGQSRRQQSRFAGTQRGWRIPASPAIQCRQPAHGGHHAGPGRHGDRDWRQQHSGSQCCRLNCTACITHRCSVHSGHRRRHSGRDPRPGQRHTCSRGWDFRVNTGAGRWR